VEKVREIAREKRVLQMKLEEQKKEFEVNEVDDCY